MIWKECNEKWNFRYYKKIEIDKKVDFNKIFTNRKLEEVDILAIITYCLKNNIDEITEIYDIDYNDFLMITTMIMKQV